MFLIFLEKQFFKHLFHHHFIQICWNSLRNIGHTVDRLYKDALLLAKSKMLDFSRAMLSCLYKKTWRLRGSFWSLWGTMVTITVFILGGIRQTAFYFLWSTIPSCSDHGFEVRWHLTWIFLHFYCLLIDEFNHACEYLIYETVLTLINISK